MGWTLVIQIVLAILTAVLAVTTAIGAWSAHRSMLDAKRQASDARFETRFGVYNAFEGEANQTAFAETLRITDEEMEQAGLTPETLRLYLLLLNRLWASVATSESFGYDELKGITNLPEKRARLEAMDSYWPDGTLISRMLGSAEFKRAWDGLLRHFWHPGDDAVFAHLIDVEIGRRSPVDVNG